VSLLKMATARCRVFQAVGRIRMCSSHRGSRVTAAFQSLLSVFVR